jgi:hypothetical protein
MTYYEQMKTALPQLTPNQLKDLSNRCKALLSRETPEVDWLLEGIIEELKLKSIPIPAMSKVIASNVFPSYSEKSKVVRELLESQASLTRLQKRQLAKICTQCLVAYIQKFTDVSLATVMLYIDRMPVAIERAFPGYLASNLLLFIIRNPVRDTQ